MERTVLGLTTHAGEDTTEDGLARFSGRMEWSGETEAAGFGGERSSKGWGWRGAVGEERRFCSLEILLFPPPKFYFY